MHKIRGQSYFLKHATSDQSDKTFLLAPKQLSPRVVCPCPGALYIHVWNKTKYHIKGIFLELEQNDGNKKSFKMLPDLVPGGCMPMPCFFFSNDYPVLTLSIFMTGSNLFLMLLYGWQLIKHWVLLDFQVCSNSAYPQHSGEQYRTNGPLVVDVYIKSVGQ